MVPVRAGARREYYVAENGSRTDFLDQSFEFLDVDMMDLGEIKRIPIGIRESVTERGLTYRNTKSVTDPSPEQHRTNRERRSIVPYNLFSTIFVRGSGNGGFRVG